MMTMRELTVTKKAEDDTRSPSDPGEEASDGSRGISAISRRHGDRR
jgi:hypothetical protein